LSRLYGLIGFPLGHSKSAEYFNSRFLAAGLTDAHYRLFPISSLQELPHILEQHPDLSGLNVTIPYKEKIIPMLTEVDGVAREIGSVNVVVIHRSAGAIRLKGYNTDAVAFLASMQGQGLHRSALVLGTGGSARSVAWALGRTGTDVLFVSRDRKGPAVISYKELWNDPLLIRDRTLIVNTTPAGMFPNSDTSPDIPYDYLGPDHLLYDLVYNPNETKFLQKGITKGTKVQSGEEMFLRQAELSYALFTVENADLSNNPA
jgi:shikimate dehydrogenase